MLTVYKASAGSGKTFRLAVEYIKRLIIADNNYEHTLAVTFTNKATEEMKMRILSQLYGLAHRLESSQGYMAVILHDLTTGPRIIKSQTVNEDFIAERAGMALSRLLHDYSYFRVQTIDKFFQTVLRNLARELDLSPSLRVELSAKEIEYKAVDSWIDNLKENDKELGWILDYIHSNMQEDKKWNVIDQIKKFGEQLLHDDYKANAKALNELLDGNDKEFYRNYTSRLREIVRNATKIVNDLAQPLWQTIVDNGYDEDSFTQKKKGVGTFIRNAMSHSILDITPNSYVLAACNPDDTDASKWTSKSAPVSLKALCRETLRPRFMEMMTQFNRLQRNARSAQVTLNHLSELRMLRAIQQEIVRSNIEHDRFLLSDTQDLLGRMIDGSDSPFIFEKIGSRLHNIMIDEFQDTSRIQWKNFKVLLNDCMSHGYDNLIVGDVKQSIYRWRSGDWRLLNNIDDEFSQEITEKHLTINRRSSTRVIDFNNMFFRKASALVCEEARSFCGAEDVAMLERAYKDVEQQYPDGKAESGYVEVQFLDKDDYEANTMQYIADTITDLIDRGVKQKDIAVLVRSNLQITKIAQYCTETFRQSESESIRSISIISDEGFLLSASPAVGIIIDAIRLLLNPKDDIVRSRLSMAYQQHILKRDGSCHELLSTQLLPEEFTSSADSLLSLPLYQLCEELFSIFRLASLPEQGAYLCYFFDCLSEFLQSTPVSDPHAFVKQWDEYICRKSIESDTDNGIRLLTIHKSKGLEYGHVIIPFCDWELERGTLLWCKPTEAPFNELPVIPLDCRKKTLENTIYEGYYREEHTQNLVDNLNLLYVAFTRAKDGLYITTRKGQKETHRGHIIEAILPGMDCYTSGEITVEKDNEEAEHAEENVFLQPSTPLHVNIKTNTHQPEFRESNKSKEFILTDEDEQEQLQSQYIQLGNILHNLFASIRTQDDIPSALLRLEMDGLLYGQDITAEMLRQHIENSMNNPQIADWFSNRWQLYNECTILTYDPYTDTHQEHRPDRVMANGEETIVVDFKLHSFKDSYRDQVRRYMTLMRRMGHKNVRGYLWLVLSNKIIEVKD